MAENAYHVLTVDSAGTAAVLDGLTVRSGNAPDSDTDGGGGVCGDSSNWTCRNCLFTLNRGHGGGALRIWGQGTRFVGCRFTHNWSKWGSGISSYFGDLTIFNCDFAGNQARFDGACLQTARGNILAANCTFSGNQGNAGGALYLHSGQATFVNCTLANNYAVSRGSSFVTKNESELTLANCLLWSYTNALREQIYAEATSTITIHHTDLQGGQTGIKNASGTVTMNWGDGNIDVDPQLGTPGGADLRLRANSPCLDAGDNSALPADTFDLDGDLNTAEPLPADYDGLPRAVTATVGPVIPTVDMGAFEYQADCNHNQVPDSLDLAAGTSHDCDHDFVPDECDPDSDSDGVPDGCDKCPNLASPDNRDTDEDGIGDPCDNCPTVSNPDQADMDADGRGDVCDDDRDGDGIASTNDNCPGISNLDQADADGDHVGDACDNCPDTSPGIPVDPQGCPPVIPGDLDHDGDVDQTDFGVLQACFTGWGVGVTEPACEAARLDADQDVDQADVAVFRHCFSGANMPADPGCAN